MDKGAVMENSDPKEFEATSEVLPITKQGIASYKDFKKNEEKSHHLLWLKRIGLANDEIKLYRENESDLGKRHIESGILKNKLENIYKKINAGSLEAMSIYPKDEEQPSTSGCSNQPNISEESRSYPEGHPMNNIKKLENVLFGHLKVEDIIPVNKRRKILRHLERKKERILSQGQQSSFHSSVEINENPRPGSLWDVREMPPKQQSIKNKHVQREIGPKKPTLYTVQNNKIVRLEPLSKDQNRENGEYKAVEIVMPINAAEERLLEGTKMSVDDIRKIDRFKDYEPGIPSKVLYLKNLAASVTLERLSLLFNQFIQDNGGPIDVRLMSGRMRGQAFIAFQNEDTALHAMDEVNGTILSGRPIIAQFGRNSNRIQDDIR